MVELKKTALGVKKRIEEDSLSLVAAGVAFYIFLSIFPALASAISLYGLVADPQTIQNHVAAAGSFVPAEVMGILEERLQILASRENGTHIWGMTLGILISLWSANKAMKALAWALDIAYDTNESRGFIKFNATTLALTLLSIVAFIVAVSVVVIVPIIVSVFLSQQTAAVFTTLVSWALFLFLLVAMCLLLYNFAPDRRHRNWKELVPGAVITAILFIIASSGFAFYVANFGKFNEEYGALGAVVVTLLWIFIGAFIFLFGAEINAERVSRSRDRKAQRTVPSPAGAAA